MFYSRQGIQVYGHYSLTSISDTSGKLLIYAKINATTDVNKNYRTENDAKPGISDITCARCCVVVIVVLLLQPKANMYLH